MLLKIYCENIVVAFLIFYIIFPSNFIHTFLFFLSPPHTYTHSSSILFLFLLDSRTFSSSLCDKKQRKNKQKISCLLHHWSKDTSRRKILLAPSLLALCLFFFFFFFCGYNLINFKIVFLSLYFDYAWV